MKCPVCGAEVNEGRFCPECGTEVITEQKIHREKLNIVKKYEDKIAQSPYTFYVGDEIPDRLINNAIANFAPDLDRNAVIALYDMSPFGGCKEGTVFTDNEIYYKENLKSTVKITFADIDHIEYSFIYYKNGDEERWDPPAEFDIYYLFSDLLDIDKKYGVTYEKKKLLARDIIEKYGRKIPASNYKFDLKGNISNKSLKMAINKYAWELSEDEVLGLIDTSITGSGRTGMIFTERAIYQNIEKEFPRILYYSEIVKAEVDGIHIKVIYKRGGEKRTCDEIILELDREGFVKFLEEIKNID